jgi:hypothetical protein
MSQNRLTADDLWPLVLKLSQDEQVRLANRTFEAAGRASEEARGPAGNARTQPPRVHRFEGIFFDGMVDSTKEEQEGNTIEQGTLSEVQGRRVLRLKGRSQLNDYMFELVAHEQDASRAIFKGTWWFAKNVDEAEAVELRLYGDPAGEFALVGGYFYEHEHYCWTMELFPLED